MRRPSTCSTAPAVVAAARAAGADALHPGYGFLAEQADFAEAVEAAGIRWVGPPPSAIRAMGDKAAARRLAADLGVETLPGYDGDDQSDKALATGREADRRAAHRQAVGGRWRQGHAGRPRPRGASPTPSPSPGARPQAAFGDDRLILERYLEGPRHVEIQVLFDAHGNGVHLGERDCSLQRRHQKVLEETPSPRPRPRRSAPRWPTPRCGSPPPSATGAPGRASSSSPTTGTPTSSR